MSQVMLLWTVRADLVKACRNILRRCWEIRELGGPNPFLGKHDRDAILDPVDHLAIDRDQSLGQSVLHRPTGHVEYLAIVDGPVQGVEFASVERAHRRFAYRAAEDVE